ncbi:MAG: ISAzo13 family transposase [Solirubrobacteraceae bacterium]
MSSTLDERGRRRWCAAEARSHGRGGIAAVARVTGVSRRTIDRGLVELDRERVGEQQPPASGRVRRPGAGRRSLIEADPKVVEDLERLVDPATLGDPKRPLRWTSKSASKLAEGLRELGHELVDRSVLRLLHLAGYTMQQNVKTREGADHPDRDAQFQYINDASARAITACEPVISVDTKHRELVGEFKNGGREWARSGEPVEVNTHDFPSHAKGKAIPYGVYDLARNEGWVSVGISRDTASFAVNSIGSWWEQLGKPAYPHARSLTITADSGGSNSARGRLWKLELQKLADRTGLEIVVCHFPRGTSKWNKIEHRLFSFISHNWRGKPLIDYATIINLITSTTTSTGLKVYARLDETDYPKGVAVSDTEIAKINLNRHEFHGDWNYTIAPRSMPVIKS